VVRSLTKALFLNNIKSNHQLSFHTISDVIVVNIIAHILAALNQFARSSVPFLKADDQDLIILAGKLKIPALNNHTFLLSLDSSFNLTAFLRACIIST
jgi:ribosomal protein L11 methylase PrmA